MLRFQSSSRLAILSILLLTLAPLKAPSQTPCQTPYQIPSKIIDTPSPELRSQFDLFSRIDRIATQVLEATCVPSASIAVVQHGKLAYIRSEEHTSELQSLRH